VKTRSYGQPASSAFIGPDGTDAILEEAMMTKTFAFTALSFGLAAALLGAMPSLLLPEKTMAAASQHIDVSEVGRSASGTMMLFDDTYQRHMGVLDVLKTQ
jgi:hypothetical protein